MTDFTCKERWASHKNSRIADIRRLWKAYQEGEDSSYYKRVAKELGDLDDYGLCLDYVAPYTWPKQPRGFWRYQISTGGPGDQFNFYGEVINDYKVELEYVTYQFLDWGDGYERRLGGSDLALMKALFDMWAECGTLVHIRNEALEEV